MRRRKLPWALVPLFLGASTAFAGHQNTLGAPAPEPVAPESRTIQSVVRAPKAGRAFWVMNRDANGRVQAQWRTPPDGLGAPTRPIPSFPGTRSQPASASPSTRRSETTNTQLAGQQVTISNRADGFSTLRVTQQLQVGQTFQVGGRPGSGTTRDTGLTLQGAPIPNGRRLAVNEFIRLSELNGNVNPGGYQAIFYGTQRDDEGNVIPSHVAFVLEGTATTAIPTPPPSALTSQLNAPPRQPNSPPVVPPAPPPAPAALDEASASSAAKAIRNADDQLKRLNAQLTAVQTQLQRDQAIGLPTAALEASRQELSEAVDQLSVIRDRVATALESAPANPDTLNSLTNALTTATATARETKSTDQPPQKKPEDGAA